MSLVSKKQNFKYFELKLIAFLENIINLHHLLILPISKYDN